MNLMILMGSEDFVKEGKSSEIDHVVLLINIFKVNRLMQGF